MIGDGLISDTAQAVSVRVYQIQMQESYYCIFIMTTKSANLCSCNKCTREFTSSDSNSKIFHSLSIWWFFSENKILLTILKQFHIDAYSCWTTTKFSSFYYALENSFPMRQWINAIENIIINLIIPHHFWEHR